MLSPLHWRARTLYVRPPLSGAPDARRRPGHGAAAVHDDRHASASTASRRARSGPGRAGSRPSLQQRFVNLGFSGEVALEITFTIGLLTMVGLISGLYRLGVLGMRSVGRRPRHDRAVAALRALADPDRAGLRRRALLLAADVPGPGDGLARSPIRSATARTCSAPRRRRSTTTSSAPTASGTCRSSRSCSATRPGLTLAHDRALVVYDRAARRDPLAVLDACGHGRLHQPRASGSCPPPRNDRRSRWPTPATGTTRCSTWRPCSSWSSCSGSRSAASAGATPAAEATATTRPARPRSRLELADVVGQVAVDELRRPGS